MNRLLAQNPEDSFNLASPALGTPFERLPQIRAQNAIQFVISFLFVVGSVAFFIMLLWGGVQWITSGGDKEGVEKARKKITQSAIGLCILFSSYAIMILIDKIFLGGSEGIFSFTLPNLFN